MTISVFMVSAVMVSFMKIDGKMRKNLQIRFLNNNEFELTQTKFNDSDLRRVVVKKVWDMFVLQESKTLTNPNL